MKDCLVTDLMGQTSNPDGLKIGELRYSVPYNKNIASSKVTGTTVKMTILTDGVLWQGTSSNVFSIDGSDKKTTGDCIVSIDDKYNLKTIQGNNIVFIEPINLGYCINLQTLQGLLPNDINTPIGILDSCTALRTILLAVGNVTGKFSDIPHLTSLRSIRIPYYDKFDDSTDFSSLYSSFPSLEHCQYFKGVWSSRTGRPASAAPMVLENVVMSTESNDNYLVNIASCTGTPLTTKKNILLIGSRTDSPAVEAAVTNLTGRGYTITCGVIHL